MSSACVFGRVCVQREVSREVTQVVVINWLDENKGSVRRGDVQRKVVAWLKVVVPPFLSPFFFVGELCDSQKCRMYRMHCDGCGATEAEET